MDSLVRFQLPCFLSQDQCISSHFANDGIKSFITYEESLRVSNSMGRRTFFMMMMSYIVVIFYINPKDGVVLAFSLGLTQDHQQTGLIHLFIQLFTMHLLGLSYMQQNYMIYICIGCQSKSYTEVSSFLIFTVTL